MRAINWLKKSLTGLTDAIARFPITTIFLLVAATINAYDITITDQTYTKFLFTFIVGAFLSAVAEVAHERWYSKLSIRLILMGLSILLTAGYYLIVMNAEVYDMALNIRTEVALFALLIAFIWVPVIKSEISFKKLYGSLQVLLYRLVFLRGYFRRYQHHYSCYRSADI